MLHDAERRTTTTKVVKETETEAIAFVVGKAVGSRWAAPPPKGSACYIRSSDESYRHGTLIALQCFVVLFVALHN